MKICRSGLRPPPTATPPSTRQGASPPTLTGDVGGSTHHASRRDLWTGAVLAEEALETAPHDCALLAITPAQPPSALFFPTCRS
jgi:hypothetical protein